MKFAQLEETTNPYPLYAKWRQEQPIWWAEDEQAWVVSRYQDVRSVLKNPGLFSSVQPESRSGQRVSLPLLHDDPPRHTQLRSIVNRSFTSNAMKVMEQDLAHLVETMLDNLDKDTPIDIAADFTIPLPVVVISNLLGIETSRGDDFKRWSDALTATGTSKSMEERLPDIQAMMAYFQAEIPKRKANPGTDLISKVVAAEVDGERLSDADIVGYCQLLLIAGNETTTNLLSNLLIHCADHPQLWQQLRDNPDKIDAAIEETLRFDAPVQWIHRIATEETQLLGQTIAKDDTVYSVLAAANHDETNYPAPEEFRLDRPRSDHHTFGHGIHFCIGAPLARVEARYALAGLLKRFKSLHRADDSTRLNERTHSTMLRGYHHLWLQFDSA